MPDRYPRLSLRPNQIEIGSLPRILLRLQVLNGEVRNVKRIEQLSVSARILMCAIFVLAVAAMAIAPQVGAQRGGGGGGGAAGQGGRGGGGQGGRGAGGAGGGGTYGALRI